jgi:hypothetical protein
MVFDPLSKLRSIYKSLTRQDLIVNARLKLCFVDDFSGLHDICAHVGRLLGAGAIRFNAEGF